MGCSLRPLVNSIVCSPLVLVKGIGQNGIPF